MSDSDSVLDLDPLPKSNAVLSTLLSSDSSTPTTNFGSCLHFGAFNCSSMRGDGRNTWWAFFLCSSNSIKVGRGKKGTLDALSSGTSGSVSTRANKGAGARVGKRGMLKQVGAGVLVLGLELRWELVQVHFLPPQVSPPLRLLVRMWRRKLDLLTCPTRTFLG